MISGAGVPPHSKRSTFYFLLSQKAEGTRRIYRRCACLKYDAVSDSLTNGQFSFPAGRNRCGDKRERLEKCGIGTAGNRRADCIDITSNAIMMR